MFHFFKRYFWCQWFLFVYFVVLDPFEVLGKNQGHIQCVSNTYYSSFWNLYLNTFRSIWPHVWFKTSLIYLNSQQINQMRGSTVLDKYLIFTKYVGSSTIILHFHQSSNLTLRTSSTDKYRYLTITGRVHSKWWTFSETADKLAKNSHKFQHPKSGSP